MTDLAKDQLSGGLPQAGIRGRPWTLSPESGSDFVQVAALAVVATPPLVCEQLGHLC